MKPLLTLAMLGLAGPAAAAPMMETDRYFAVRHVDARPAPWNLAWTFHTEHPRIVPADPLVARCPAPPPPALAKRIVAGARLHGSAWCPAVHVVRESRPE